MARKPKTIETPGDTTTAQFESLAKPAGKATPQPQAATSDSVKATLAGVETIGGYPVLERRAGWVRLPHGWFKE